MKLIWITWQLVVVAHIAIQIVGDEWYELEKYSERRDD